MNKLKLIVTNEYRTAVTRKSFWIMTFALPLLMVAFGVVMGFLMSDSDSFMSTTDAINEKTGLTPDEDGMTAAKAMAMMVGVLLTFAMMICGSQIMQMVRQEKTNRIMEFLATCVTGRTMLTAKIISVALITLTQVLLWAACFLLFGLGFVVVLNLDVPFDYLLHPLVWKTILWSLLYFVGGFMMFSSLFAACGALTDSNNENQQYLTILMMCVLASMYIGMYAVDHPNSVLAQVCAYFPLTSPTVGAVNAITGEVPLWSSILSLAVLYASAYGAIVIGGKIYSSSMLLKGASLSPKAIAAFIKAK
ncbi:MAG: ABC transporter permease [Muribaculaceae bacterium]|nr:ABC transporter permease [Muribaculaceae bacterium]